MKFSIIINLINIGILLPVTLLYKALGYPKWFIVIYVIWFIYFVISNVRMMKSESPIERLKKADERRLFRKEINVIITTVESVEFYREVFSKFDESSPVIRTFNILAEKTESNVDKAVNWISTYNYHTRPPKNYLDSLVSSCQAISAKLSELNELVIKIDDDTNDVDMTFVDDMLSSLKEIVEDED